MFVRLNWILLKCGSICVCFCIFLIFIFGNLIFGTSTVLFSSFRGFSHVQCICKIDGALRVNFRL